MEEQNIMNEEVVEATEEVVTETGSGKVFKVLVGAGIVAGVVGLGRLAYKRLIKPLVNKLKNKKKEDVKVMPEDEEVEAIEDDCDDILHEEIKSLDEVRLFPDEE